MDRMDKGGAYMAAVVVIIKASLIVSGMGVGDLE